MNKTIQSCKYIVKEAAKTRNITRHKYWTPKYDVLILNGIHVEYAFQRLFIISPLLIKALEKKDKKTVELATTKLKVCLHDCVILKKITHLLPDDYKLRDTFIQVVKQTNTKLTNIGTKK